MKTIYVSPNGLSTNTGLIPESPLDLQTAFNLSTLASGDIVLLRGGVYTHTPQGVTTGNQGYIYQITVSGSTLGQITFRSYPGELARIDGGAYGGIFASNASARPTIKIGDPSNPALGNYVTLQDIEVFSSSTEPRTSAGDLSIPLDIFRSDGINIYGSGVKIINCCVHDLTTGISIWTQSLSGEIYGNVIYNNGWQGNPHQHGHNIYAQHGFDGTLPLIIKRNILVSPYDRNIQMYGSSVAQISRFRFAENIAVGQQGQRGSILLGTRSGGVMDRVKDNQITNNFGYGADLAVYYQPDDSAYHDVAVMNNYMVECFFESSSYKMAKITLNFISQKINKIVSIWPNTGGVIPGWLMDLNNYVISSLAAQLFIVEGEFPRDFVTWKARTGFDASSLISAALPTAAKIVLQPNDYDSNRAQVAVYNWSGSAAIQLNVTSLGWLPGSLVSVRNAQNYLTDSYTATVGVDGSIWLDMRVRPQATPTGDSSPIINNTFPAFGVFILVRTNPPVLSPLDALSAKVVAAQTASVNLEMKSTLGFIQSLIIEVKKLFP